MLEAMVIRCLSIYLLFIELDSSNLAIKRYYLNVNSAPIVRALWLNGFMSSDLHTYLLPASWITYRELPEISRDPV